MLSFLRRLRSVSKPRSQQVRPRLEELEQRQLLAGHVPADSLPPFAPGAPWGHSARRAFVAAQPPSLLEAMYFNSPLTEKAYAAYFQGTLRRWVEAADRAGIVDENELFDMLGRQEEAYFRQVGGILASAYPGRTSDAYRLLMAMNLAHGYFIYGSASGWNRSIHELLHLRRGDCTEIAELLRLLIRAQNIPAHELAQNYNYRTPLGRFAATHDVVYAGGMWLDAEINTAFALDLATLRRIPPAQRLRQLLAADRVYGFYNLYLEPHVRRSQLRHGVDGGIIAFYYQYYFAGIGAGRSEIHFVAGT